MSIPTRINLSTSEDVLTAVPYLLGFHPTNSLVFVCLRDGNVSVTGRIDLHAGKPPADRGVRTLVDRLAADGVTAVILIGYGTPTAVTVMTDAFLDACRALHLAVREALRVTDDRYWSYLCPGGDCCPIDGTPLPETADAIAAGFVATGHIALPSREDLASALDPIDDLDTVTTLIAAIRLAPESCAQVEALLQRYASDVGDFPDIAETALILTWLHLDEAVLRAALAHIDLNPPVPQVELWIWLTRHAPPQYLAEPASVLAYTAWRAGNGALARIACERALAAVPEHRLARLVIEFLNAGANPTGVPPLASFGTDTAT